MNSLTNVYLDTINPQTPYKRLLSNDVFLSILLHVVLYLIIVCLVSKLFNLKISKKLYINITISLLFVMIMGYIGRLARSKSIYINLIKNNVNNNLAIEKTMNIMHNAYFTYYFLG